MATMFQRMFGRRRSPVEDETSAEEATEERADEVNTDGFVLLDDAASQNNNVFDPPPGYTLGGANAFLPYGIDPRASTPGTLQRMSSAEPMSAIDGVPFKLGSKILIEGNLQDVDLSSVTQMIKKINTFNWDDYEYSFQLEKSILQEFNTSDQEQTLE